MKTHNQIRAYLRKELLTMNERAKTGKRVPFTRDQIAIEIERRYAAGAPRCPYAWWSDLNAVFS